MAVALPTAKAETIFTNYLYIHTNVVLHQTDEIHPSVLRLKNICHFKLFSLIVDHIDDASPLLQ